MSAFETTVNVVATQVGIPDEEAQKQGATDMEVSLAIGQQLPFAQQPGAPPMMAMLGAIKFSMNKESAMKFFTAGLEAAEKLPEVSKLEVATDLKAAEAQGAALDVMRGGENGTS